MPRFCVFRSCSVFVLCGARACEQSLGNARTPQGRSACLSISLVECRKLCHSGIFRPELWHAWDRMSCDMSCDRPSQRGLGCKRLCSSCRAWKKTKAWSAESKQILGHSRSRYLINSNHIYDLCVSYRAENFECWDVPSLHWDFTVLHESWLNFYFQLHTSHLEQCAHNLKCLRKRDLQWSHIVCRKSCTAIVEHEITRDNTG